MRLIKEKFIKPKTAIHARSTKEIETLCKWAYQNNYNYINNNSFYNEVLYNSNDEEIAFDFFKLRHKPLKDYIDDGYDIVTLNDITEPFFGKELIKEDNNNDIKKDIKFLYFLAIINGLFVNWLIWFR